MKKKDERPEEKSFGVFFRHQEMPFSVSGMTFLSIT